MLKKAMSGVSAAALLLVASLGHASALKERCYALENAGQLKAALETCQRAAEQTALKDLVSWHAGELQRSIGRILWRLERPSDALLYFDEALQIWNKVEIVDPTEHANTTFQYGRLLQLLGDQRAANFFREAVDRGSPDAAYHLAKILEVRPNQQGEAIALYDFSASLGHIPSLIKVSELFVSGERDYINEYHYDIIRHLAYEYNPQFFVEFLKITPLLAEPEDKASFISLISKMPKMDYYDVYQALKFLKDHEGAEKSYVTIIEDELVKRRYVFVLHDKAFEHWWGDPRDIATAKTFFKLASDQNSEYASLSLAQIYASERDYSQSDSFLSIALDQAKLQMRLYNEETILFFDDIKNLHVETLLARGLLDDAEQVQRELIQYHETQDADFNVHLVEAIYQLADIKAIRGEFDAALEVHNSAIQALQSVDLSNEKELQFLFSDFSIFSFSRKFDMAKSVLSKIESKVGGNIADDSFPLALVREGFAQVYLNEGRFHLAEEYADKALPIIEKGLEELSPNLARTYALMAKIKNAVNKPSEARRYLLGAVQVAREHNLLGHPEAVEAALDFAPSIPSTPLSDAELDIFAEITTEFAMRSQRQALTGSFLVERDRVREPLLKFAKIFLSSGRETDKHYAFTALESRRAISISEAIGNAITRLETSDPKLSQLLKQREILISEWREAANAFDLARVRKDQSSVEKGRSLSEIQIDIDKTLLEIEKISPQSLSYLSPGSIKLSQLQEIISEDEVIVSWSVGAKQTIAWAVGNNFQRSAVLEIGNEQIKSIVDDIRKAVDPTGKNTLDDLGVFPIEKTQQLYRELVEPLQIDASIRHFVFIPDGPLLRMPPAILHDGRQWLIEKATVVVVPSADAFAALRTVKSTAAKRSFLGVGDPLLRNHPSQQRANTGPISIFPPTYPDNSLDIIRGSLTDVRAVRSLTSLPETADELQSLATQLGPNDSELLLRDTASEMRFREIPNLADFRVVAFATHGLLAGEIEGLNEPALVLSPPDEPNALDDGILTASEIAVLSMNADWIVLSACNTGVSQSGGEGLSSLAKAFFHAGARRLLVTHWPVVSDAAVQMTTNLFQHLASGATPAAAKRQSVLDTMKQDRFAHPVFWAPFVLVGAS